MVPTPRWGTGGVLSDLQLRVARIIAGLVEAEDFALAGGAALIVRGDEERATRDLDFFGTSADAVDHLVPAAPRCWIASHAFGGTSSPSTTFGSKSSSIGFKCGEWVRSN